MKNLSYKHIFKVFCIKLKINVQHVYKKTNKNFCRTCKRIHEETKLYLDEII